MSVCRRSAWASALALALLQLGTTTGLAAAPPAHFELLNRFSAGSNAVAVTSGGTRAFLAGGAGIQAVEIVAGSSLRSLGELTVLEGRVEALTAPTPSRLYAAVEPSWLWVVDTSEPATMRRLGAVDVGAVILSLAVTDHWVLLALGEAGFAVVDVADATMPVVVGRLPTPMMTRDVAVVAWPLVYLAERDPFNSGVRVVDLSDPAAPRDVTLLAIPGGVDRLALAGTRLVAMGPTGWLWTVDIQSPRLPRRLAPLIPQTNMRFRAVAAVGDFAFVAAEGPGGGMLQVVDVRDPRTLSQVAVVGVIGVPMSFSLMDGTLWVATGASGIQIYDVRQPLRPVRLADRLSPVVADVADLVVAGDYLYAIGAGGLSTIDIRVPGQPQIVHTLSLAGRLRDMAYRPQGPELIVAGQPSTIGCIGGACPVPSSSVGLQRVYLGQPEAPVAVGVDSDIAALAVVATGSEVFAVVAQSFASVGTTASWLSGLAGFSLSGNVSSPRARSLARFAQPLLLSGGPVELVVANGQAYAAGSEIGLAVFDADQPNEVRLRATLATDGLATGRTLVVAGSLLTVGTGEGLLVVDVADPLAPRVVATQAVAGGIDHLARGGDYLVAVTSGRVELYDADDPLHPRRLDQIDLAPLDWSPPPAELVIRPRIAVAGRRAFVALSGRGVSELAIVDGERGTAEATITPIATTPTPDGTPSATPSLSATVTPQATPTATRSATPRPTRVPGQVYLPLLDNGSALHSPTTPQGRSGRH